MSAAPRRRARSSRSEDRLLLGEWACLGVIDHRPAHGFEVARRLSPEGDLGRVWSLTRPLTYRSIDQLVERGVIAPASIEPGRAGGERTIYAATPTGRRQLRTWLTTPVDHLRDMRSEFLLKVVIARLHDRDTSALVAVQRSVVERTMSSIEAQCTSTPDDMVTLWRQESCAAALRFLDRLDTTR
jgi:DNA-binding PadR family transcriptional regulator